MIIAVFGSNMIERAGLGWDITLHLCRRIIAGEDVGEISERDADYQDALVKLCMQQPNLENMPCHAILRGRNEIVQHVKAFQHLINAFVTDKQSLSEDLIKETHRILTKGTPIIQDGSPNVAPEAYGGTYRTVIVGAGSSNFTVPKYVPTNTKEMCDNLEKEVVTAEKGGATDPFSLAAKYSLENVRASYPGEILSLNQHAVSTARADKCWLRRIPGEKDMPFAVLDYEKAGIIRARDLKKGFKSQADLPWLVNRVMGFDEGFTCPPPGCRLRGLSRWKMSLLQGEGLGVWKRVRCSGEGEMPPIAFVPVRLSVGMASGVATTNE
ncbi:fic/DOC family protein [Ophiocordyceps sinensis CO18]|uniref:Fic/DOC family protein n=1 Tax=Ophiocordyceps sinensis (strain Co18 / CGMCC 3.14243) TaxID=911162 RepID=T5AQU7_OPHSC|nr:fic/DOC family protein [Ophiocordyceps sinensis CO18]